MDKVSRYFPFVALVLLLILVYLLLFSQSRLNEALDRLDAAEQKIDSTLRSLATAKSAIDTVQSDLVRFGAYVRDIQGRVEIMDLSQRADDDRFRGQQAKIQARLKELYKEIQNTGKELPEIPVVGPEKKQ